MGQTIKPVCICQCVYLSVGTLTVHFLIDFHQNWHRRKNPQKVQIRWLWVNIAPPLPPFCPPKLHFRPRGPENPCNINNPISALNVCISPKFLHLIANRCLVTSDFRPEVEIWLLWHMCNEKYAM